MIPGWPERLCAAQLQTTTRRDGQTWQRLPHGSEHHGTALTCYDCATQIGDLHVAGCAVERCPSCGDQFAFCYCERS